MGYRAEHRENWDIGQNPEKTRDIGQNTEKTWDIGQNTEKTWDKGQNTENWDIGQNTEKTAGYRAEQRKKNYVIPFQCHSTLVYIN